eukprot:gnl/TRDRNA2_/TRDRNA2_43279_c0_seq1.p2 gnl/TRDRNA2_/TRDRNA2_43279_c0~~gnl/TRDRNA2_/TRDRNA2_43279_c0_seq1.p2  ORF type:complete len:332 (-),score=75.59 gnl/TRDRNA2_/TRDRNA2_43279_c0_seq1:72-1040(-)
MTSAQTASPLPATPFRPDILAGRVVLVTGGATGIGYACCEAFGRHGAKVALMGRRQAVLDKAAASLQSMGIEVFAVPGDVRDYDRCVAVVDSVAKHFGRLDYLINNAAGNFMVSAENLTPNGLATVLGIDLQGCFHMAKAVLPVMKRTGPTDGACIVNVTAFLQDRATPFQGHAAAAKAGIDVMTNQIGVEWGEYGIRCVGLAPGGIAGTVGGPGGRVFGNNENKTSSDSIGSAAETNFGEPPPEQVRRKGIPAGRWGRVEDVALAAVFMCGPAAGWITATRLTIDGGSSHGAVGFLDAKRAIEQKSALQKEQFSGGVKSKL